ncbi:MAG TPA: hypothetical protein VGB84_01340, partial [Arachidicoccus sp.]
PRFQNPLYQDKVLILSIRFCPKVGISSLFILLTNIFMAIERHRHYKDVSKQLTFQAIGLFSLFVGPFRQDLM